MMADIYNAIVEAGVGAVFQTVDPKTGAIGLFAGFPQLDPKITKELLESFGNFSISDTPGPSPDDLVIPRINRRKLIEGINEIGSDQVKQWLDLLGPATQDNTFDSVYDQLLQEGMDQLELLIMEAVFPQGAIEARTIIQTAASRWYAYSTGIRPTSIDSSVRAQRRRFLEKLAEVPSLIVSASCSVQADAALVQLKILTGVPITEIHNAWANLSWALLFNLGPEAEMVMTCAFAEIIRNFVGQGQNLDQETTQNFINFMNRCSDRLAGQTQNIESAFERCKSTFNAASKSSTKGWQIKYFDKSMLGPDGKHYVVDLILLKQDPNFAQGKSVVSFLQIDLSTTPDVDEIIGWLDAALIQIDNAMQKYGADIGTITYAFEHPQNNTSMEALVKTLAEKYAGTRTPIIIAWRDEAGNDHVVCIGCNDQFTLKDAAKQACEQKGICVDEADDASSYLNQNSSDLRVETSTIESEGSNK